MHEASFNAHHIVLSKLMSHPGVSPSILASNQWTILHSAVSNSKKDEGEINRCVDVVLSKGVGINEQDADGRTALHLAARSGLAEVVKHLLDNGARNDIKDLSGRDASKMASRWAQYEIAEIIKNYGSSDAGESGEELADAEVSASGEPGAITSSTLPGSEDSGDESPNEAN